MHSPILIGAVIYDPKVVVIWDIIKDFFKYEGYPMDYVFYSNYELQVEALLEGHIDIAWSSPLAWVDAQRLSNGGGRALALRGNHPDRVKQLLLRPGDGIRGKNEMRGKKGGTGAQESP